MDPFSFFVMILLGIKLDEGAFLVDLRGDYVKGIGRFKKYINFCLCFGFREFYQTLLKEYFFLLFFFIGRRGIL